MERHSAEYLISHYSSGASIIKESECSRELRRIKKRHLKHDISKYPRLLHMFEAQVGGGRVMHTSLTCQTITFALEI